ncbi:MAG: hypothetical protein O2960_28315, partial [Verrucomicrobia bacterium]|nr:hypothetical protein [Verrucomicrobiota bacterium]
CGPQNLLLNVHSGGTNNDLDHNLWFSKSGDSTALFSWNGTTVRGLKRFQDGSGQGMNSLFSDPKFSRSDQADFHLMGESTAIDRGDSEIIGGSGEMDVDEEPRLAGFRIDIGADEVSPLQVESVSGGVVRVSWPTSFSGYVIEKAGGLLNGAWFVVSPNQTSFNGARKVLEEMANVDSQFYRIRKN